MLSPLPAVIVTCGDMESPNAMTAAWTGIVCSEPAQTYVSIMPRRYSHGIITEKKEFVINLTTTAMVRATDYIGIRSGRDEDKLAKMHLTPIESFEVACPAIAESPLSLECRVKDIIHLGSHDMFLAEIVAVSVDDSFIDEKGKLRLENSKLIAYSHGDYIALGKKLGSFGFSVRKKKPVQKGGGYKKK